jgi:hypothetical protein
MLRLLVVQDGVEVALIHRFSTGTVGGVEVARRGLTPKRLARFSRPLLATVEV